MLQRCEENLKLHNNFSCGGTCGTMWYNVVQCGTMWYTITVGHQPRNFICLSVEKSTEISATLQHRKISGRVKFLVLLTL